MRDISSGRQVRDEKEREPLNVEGGRGYGFIARTLRIVEVDRRDPYIVVSDRHSIGGEAFLAIMGHSELSG